MTAATGDDYSEYLRTLPDLSTHFPLPLALPLLLLFAPLCPLPPLAGLAGQENITLRKCYHSRAIRV